MYTLYGLKNCDRCRKARAWLDEHGLQYHFHDLRDDGLNTILLHQWVALFGWENLLNRKSTTWRNLPDGEKSDLGPESAIERMLHHPTLIKRPLLIAEQQAACLLGFTPDLYSKIL